MSIVPLVPKYWTLIAIFTGGLFGQSWQGDFRYPLEQEKLQELQAAILGQNKSISSGPMDILQVPEERVADINRVLLSLPNGINMASGQSQIYETGRKTSATPSYDAELVRDIGYYVSRMPVDYKIKSKTGQIPLWAAGARVLLGVYQDPEARSTGVSSACRRLVDYLKNTAAKDAEGTDYILDLGAELYADNTLRGRINGRIAYTKLQINNALKQAKTKIVEGVAAGHRQSVYPIEIKSAIIEQGQLRISAATEEERDGTWVTFDEKTSKIKLLSRELDQEKKVALIFIQNRWHLPIGGRDFLLTERSSAFRHYAETGGGHLFLGSNSGDISFHEFSNSASNALERLRALEQVTEAGAQDNYESLLNMLLETDNDPTFANVISLDEVVSLLSLDATIKSLVARHTSE